MHSRRPNVVMFMLDTLRASDTYTNSALTNINRMAMEGLSYTNAVAPGTWTATSHASMFTGKPVSAIPDASKDLFNGGTEKIDPWFVKTKFLPDSINTLASKLGSMGYSTSLFSNNPFLNSMTNLSEGFQTTYDLWKDTNASKKGMLSRKASKLLQGGSRTRIKMMDVSYAVSRILPAPLLDKLYLDLRVRLDRGVAENDFTYKMDRGANRTNKVIKSYIRKRAQSDIMPKFMFINYIEAHENYPVRKEIVQDKWLYMSRIMELDENTRSELHKAYLRRIRYLDKKVGEAIKDMRESGLLDNALVILLSDHGQFFGEHGLLYHSMAPYSEVSNVPLISLRFIDGKPVKERKVIDEPVSLGRIGSAVVEVVTKNQTNLNGNMFGNVYSEHTGISEGWDEYLLAKLRRRSKFADMIYKAKMEHNRQAVAIYHNGMKLIHFYGGRPDELYAINDKMEEQNIISGHKSEAADMRKRHSKYVANHTSL